jgi:hypothetical protein
MTVFLQVTILAMRNDDTEGLVKILIVVIFCAFTIISNAIKRRSRKTAHQPDGPGSRKRALEHSQARHSSAGMPSTPDQEPGRHRAKDTNSGQATEKLRPAKLREIVLRPGSRELFSRGWSRKSVRGGSDEVLSGKSRLDRFLEAKLEPVRHTQHIPEEHLVKQSVDEVPADVSESGELDGRQMSVEQIEEETSFKLDSENLADAIVYAEILGKPLALRDM